MGSFIIQAACNAWPVLIIGLALLANWLLKKRGKRAKMDKPPVIYRRSNWR
jgi:hypothetical protein